MSKQVDERVVSMQFDNRQFERNVATSMSTLDKLKQKLNLSGASKGLENVGTAAKNVNMSGLGSAVEQVSAKFSALQVMGVTALANITNSAVNAAKRIVHSLTIAPISDGFSEYEMTLNAVQTTMAATGKTAEEVEQKLKRLDEYADKTVYSTADMLNNLPKFTNAGVDLDKATTAMIGIANATALAGGGAGQASIAFYNLGQAIGTGYLTRMDYNSINNAGIATMEWKNQMVEAAIAQGTLTKVGEDAYKAGNKTLTLQQLFIDGLQEQWATTDVLMEVFGNYGDETTEIGKKAYAAAQDIKTFSQMMESLKATAGTGWKDTWQIIFGGLDEAKEFWTGITNFISNIITSMADFRNALLESALGKGFTELSDKVKNAFKPASEAVSTVKEAVESVKDLGAVVDEVIQGKWGRGQKRWDALTEAGYNWVTVQNKVNETLGHSYRHSEELAGSLDKQLDIQKETTESTDNKAAATSNLSKEEAKRLATLATMSEAELKALGYTDEQISALRELAIVADKLGLPLEDLIMNLDEINGRWLLINSFKNIGKGLVTVFTELGNAWKSVFPKTLEERAQSIFEAITSIHKYTSIFAESLAANADEIQRTFKGMFAALDIVLTLVGGPLKIAFGIFKQILGALDMNVLEFTAVVGDNILKFRDWLDSVLDFTEVFKKIIPHIENAISAVTKWFDRLKAGEYTPEQVADTIIKGFKKVIGFVGDVFKKLRDVILGEAKNIPEDFVSGFSEGILARLGFVGEVIVELGKSILAYFRDVLGIESPSTETHEDGENFVQGFINGVKDFIGKAVDVVKDFGKKCLDVIKNIDFGAVFVGILSSGVVISLMKISNALESFSAPFEGFGDVLEEVSETVKVFKNSLKGVLKSVKFNLRAKAIKELAIAIGILAASLFLLSLVDPMRLIAPVIAVAAMAGILWGVSSLMAKIDTAGGFNFAKVAAMLLSFGTAMLMMSAVLKIIETMDPNKSEMVFDYLTGMLVSFVSVIFACGMVEKAGGGANIGKFGSMMLKMAAGLLLMTFVIKIIGGMDAGVLNKGFTAMFLMVGFITLMGVVSGLAGKSTSKFGSMMLKVSAAMLLMVVVIKLISWISLEEIMKGILVMSAFGILIAGMTAITRLAGGKDLSKLGRTLISMAASMLLMAIIVKLLGGMNPDEVKRGTLAVVALGGVISALTLVTKFAGKDLKGVGTTLILMAGAVGILAMIAVLLGMVDLNHLIKGFVAVALLSGLIAMLTIATKNAKNVKGNIIAMAIAIGIMTAAVVGLSFIDPGKLATATASLAALMGMFALLVGVTKYAKNTKHMRKSLITLMGVVIVLAGVVAVLSLIDSTNALPNVLALSALMIAFSASLFIMGKAGRISTTVTKNLPMMLLVVAGLATILSAMSFLPNPENLLPVAIALSILLNALAASMVILGFVGPTAGKAVGPAALMGLVLAEVAIILGVMAEFTNVDALLPTAAALSLLLLALSAACLILAPIGALGGTAIAGAGVLAAVIAILGIVAIAIGELMSYIPAEKIEEWKSGINKLMDLLSTLAYGLGEVIGSFVGGFLDGALSGLPAIGEHLSGFMENAQPFIDGVKSVDGSVLKGVGVLTAAIIALSAADLINGVTSFLSGGSSFSTLGTELSNFMTNAQGFIEGASSLSPELTSGVKTLAEAILVLTAADVINGLTSWFTGGTSLADFGKELEVLGPSMKAYSNSVAGIDSEAVTTSAEAAKTLAEMAKSMPKEGGLISKIFGDGNLETFASQLEAFGTALAGYSKAVSSGINVEAINSSAEAGKALAAMAEAIPNSGGLFADLFGDNDLEEFGYKLVRFGTAITRYSKVVSAGINSDAISSSVEAGKQLSTMADAIPNSGGLFADLFGDNDLETFGNKLVAFGRSIARYSKVVSMGINLEAITQSITAGKLLSKLAEAIPTDGGFWSLFKDDSISMSEFGTEIVNFGTGIKDFSDSVSGIDSGAIHSSIAAGNRLITFINNLVGLNVDGVAGFKSAIAQLGETSLDGFVNAFTNAADRLSTAGTTMIKSIINGIRSSQGLLTATSTVVMLQTVSTFNESASKFTVVGQTFVTNLRSGMIKSMTMLSSAGKTVANTAVNAIRSKYSGFYSAGSYCVSGFVNGINWNSYKATEAGWNLGKAALNAAKAAIRSNSPSKAFYELGDFSVLGFVNAFYDGLSTSEKAGSDMANSALNGLGNAMSQIKSAVDSEIDANPTIRPVLDLSNIQNGANSIGGMFAQQTVALAGINADYASINPTVGLTDLISQMQSANDTSNREVVNAITNLRGDFGSLVSAISGLHIRMDSGTVVGELIGKIDNSLGQIASYKGRGN